MEYLTRQELLEYFSARDGLSRLERSVHDHARSIFNEWYKFKYGLEPSGKILEVAVGTYTVNILLEDDRHCGCCSPDREMHSFPTSYLTDPGWMQALEAEKARKEASHLARKAREEAERLERDKEERRKRFNELKQEFEGGG